MAIVRVLRERPLGLAAGAIGLRYYKHGIKTAVAVYKGCGLMFVSFLSRCRDENLNPASTSFSLLYGCATLTIHSLSWSFWYCRPKGFEPLILLWLTCDIHLFGEKASEPDDSEGLLGTDVSTRHVSWRNCMVDDPHHTAQQEGIKKEKRKEKDKKTKRAKKYKQK